jgi:Flp pilus assembly protein TadG
MLGPSLFQNGKPSGPFPPFPNRLVSREHGQSIVEFALALPILLLILLGAIDLARAFQTLIVVTNASREGARYGSTHPTDSAGIQNQALAEASRSGVSIIVSGPACFRLDNDSSISCDSAYNGDRLKVTASANFEFGTLYLFRLSSIPITKFTTMPIITGGVVSP